MYVGIFKKRIAEIKPNDMCNNKNCRDESFPPDEFSWFRDTTSFLSPRVIAESSNTSLIFTNDCIVSDWYCQLHDSVIFWQKDVVHTCPFKRIYIGYFDSIGNIIMERNQKLGLQLKRVDPHCGFDF